MTSRESSYLHINFKDFVYYFSLFCSEWGIACYKMQHNWVIGNWALGIGHWELGISESKISLVLILSRYFIKN
ncbi:MAG: hypothetical protein HC785_05460 [Calothrix sp. CSU_2_0]|nr:hypothetical protein [Calothrix sp. CSU_2_0]